MALHRNTKIRVESKIPEIDSGPLVVADVLIVQVAF